MKICVVEILKEEIVTRLFINLFFIIIICFTLAAMPINTEILNMFDFEDIFSKEEPLESEEEPDENEDTFQAEFTYNLNTNIDKRLYNPDTFELSLVTNITEDLASDYDFSNIEMSFERNGQTYQIFQSDKFITDISQSYEDQNLVINYTFNMSKNHLNLDQDGFYKVSLESDLTGLDALTFNVAYMGDIELIHPTTITGNYTYLTYFYNQDKTHLVPIHLNISTPNSITIAVRNSLYQVPSEDSGLYPQQVIPNQTSLTRISDGYYAAFLYSREFNDLITSSAEAELMVEALSKTLLELPHIDRLTLYVDDQQVQGSLFDVDLTKIYEEQTSPVVYYPDLNDRNKSYLIPVALEDEGINASIFNMVEALTNGYVKDTYYGQVIPPEITINNLLIEENQVTLDFSQSFLQAYPNSDDYKTLMIHSLLYSITSIEGIDTLSITVDGQGLTTFGDYDLSQPLVPERHINYLEEL